MSEHFDFVIAGAGLSGVMLAWRLLQDPPFPVPVAGRPRILLVDPSFARRGPTTFAYWSRQPTPLDPWELATWQGVRLIGQDSRVRDLALDGVRYRAVSWDAARADLLAWLAADPRVQLAEAAVDEVRDGSDCARVRMGKDWASGGFVFDSRPVLVDVTSRFDSVSRRSLKLYQSFHGIWVRSEGVGIDTAAGTLLDFSADDGPDLGFAYMLPVNQQSAMVMAVRIGASVDPPNPESAVIRALGRDSWRVVGEEFGVTDLVTPARQRREGSRVLAIGGRGGRVRASTGYAVTRILSDADAIVASLRRRGHPFEIPADPRRDRVLDAVWLHTLAAQRSQLEPAFLALFDRAPIGSVLRFLDGGSSTADALRVVRALPPSPFLRSCARLTLGRHS